MLAYTNTYQMLFKHIDDWKKEIDSSYTKGPFCFIDYDTTKGDFTLLNYFEEFANKNSMCDEDALFGGMC
jgi:hypothetical protein